jgi:hypothetical protein
MNFGAFSNNSMMVVGNYEVARAPKFCVVTYFRSTYNVYECHYIIQSKLNNMEAERYQNLVFRF